MIVCGVHAREALESGAGVNIVLGKPWGSGRGLCAPFDIARGQEEAARRWEGSTTQGAAGQDEGSKAPRAAGGGKGGSTAPGSRRKHSAKRGTGGGGGGEGRRRPDKPEQLWDLPHDKCN